MVGLAGMGSGAIASRQAVAARRLSMVRGAASLPGRSVSKDADRTALEGSLDSGIDDCSNRISPRPPAIRSGLGLDVDDRLGNLRCLQMDDLAAGGQENR